MKSSFKVRKSQSLILFVALLGTSLSGTNLNAQQKKASAPAAPAKPPSTSKPGGAGSATSKAATPSTSHGPTTGGANTHGITTSSAHSATTTAGHTTTTNSSTHNTAGGIGTHPTTPTRTAVAGHPDMNAGASKMVGGHPVPPGSHVVTTPHGDQVRMRGNTPADVHVAGRNMDIHNSLTGNRRIEVERADHSRIVAERGGRGFVEHPYRYGGREYAHRSYYYHGRVYDRYYGRYNYHGVYVNYYTPAYYYRPAFYGWAYNPWVAPVPYAWGWNANPWYGYYGVAYFAPYTVYPSASFWLTDYLISASLAAAYEAHMQVAAAEQAQAAADAQALPPGAAGLTPEVKDLISAEVQRQIALENAEAQSAQTAAPDPASSSVQRMLSDNVQHIFVVSHDIDILNSSGAECAVTQGDALQLAGPPAADATTANLIVLSSKGGVECARSSTVQVQIPDLQEMQNHMRETIDSGMGELQKKQGTGSMPALPASAAGEPVKATFVAAAPPPDPNAAQEINEQLKVADQEQSKVVGEASQSPGSSPQVEANLTAAPAPVTPASISMGQSIEEVTAAMGTPTKIVDLGLKKIYVYKDMKVTFKSGKVSDVQ